MGKPLTQIVPDFREALEEGVEQAVTKTVVRDLQEAGTVLDRLLLLICGRSTSERRRSRPTLRTP